LIMLVGLYIIFRTWYFVRKNFSVITTERLVDINRTGWFDEYLSVVYFGDIIDIYVRKSGIWSNVLNFGSVSVKTFDEEKTLEINNIKSPQRILDLILEYKNLFNKRKKLRDNDSIYKTFVNIIPDLDEPQLCEIRDLVDEQLKLIDEEIEE